MHIGALGVAVLPLASRLRLNLIRSIVIRMQDEVAGVSRHPEFVMWYRGQYLRDETVRAVCGEGN